MPQMNFLSEETLPHALDDLLDCVQVLILPLSIFLPHAPDELLGCKWFPHQVISDKQHDY